MSEILKDDEPKKVDRREIIKGMFKATLGLTAGIALISTPKAHARPQSTQKTTTSLEPLPENLPKDELIYRMQRELHEAMKSFPKKMGYGY